MSHRDALRVCYASIAWGAVQGAGAVAEGIHTRSLALLGAGAALVLDVGSSSVLVWRFRQDSEDDGPERLASRVARIALATIGIALLIGGIKRLAGHASPDVSGLSLTLAAAGVVLLPLLARWKYAVAARVESGALRTDGHITMVGAAVSGVTLVGLAVTSAFDWWWADAAAALGVALIAIATAWRET